ncbi:hypothetical protein HHK36_008164 [Tetracentron sinense]|uniref:USP domain-containing protein n=1 Tax=Tetracentron sinense TaxID=13715 RepID=A0A835DN51_TETSI|nr:hypothetical protein HHK36_008164 [Tetracentron sinense]
MLVHGDLGFWGLVLVFFFCPIVGFVVRRKWRNSVARSEEIRRLVVLATEEAARAELEATVEYGAISVTRQFQCAVCYCPTTTRCARCKVVRYWYVYLKLLLIAIRCSGKCQIIHWRQGHKEECRPPSATIQFDGEGNDSGRKEVLQEQFEIESRRCIKPIETFSEEHALSPSSPFPEVPCGMDVNDKVEPLVDAKGTTTTFESSSISSFDGFSTSTNTSESSGDTSFSEVLSSSTPDRSEGHVSDCITPDMLETTTDVNEMEPTNTPPSNRVHCRPTSSAGSSIYSSDDCSLAEPATASSDFWKATLDSSGSSVVHDGSSQSKFSGASAGILSDSGSHLRFSYNLSGHTVPPFHAQCSEDKTLIPDNAHPTGLERKKPTDGAVLSEKVDTDASKVRSSPFLSSERSDSVANDRSKGSQLLKSREIESLSSNASDDHRSFSTGGHPVPSVKSAKVDSVQAVSTMSTEIASNGLKTSMRKVVQQFRSSKLSKHYPLGLGSEIAERYNYKMLFSYDRFIKLYNWNKMELRPCGLTNCGNRSMFVMLMLCSSAWHLLDLLLLTFFKDSIPKHARPKKEWCFTCEFEGLVLKVKEGKSPLSPIGILSQIQSIGSHLGHGREEDAHEFLRYAVDTMQSVCLKETGENSRDPLAEETTLIGLIFGGYLRSKIKCMKCQGKSERHERIMDLTVEIQGDIGTLEEALAQFTATEILDGENKYQCSRCKSYEKAKKKLTVLEAPNVLTIALKRFQSGKFGKLNKSVRFPEILNLAPYMSGTSDKSPIYKLYAVVVHLDIMNAAFSGHYVCYVKNIQGKWFKVDDSAVKPVELERVLSKGAYMLLYARCSPRAPSLMRNTMMSHDGKIKKNPGAVLSSHSGRSATSKERPNTTVPGISMAHRRPEDYPYWTTLEGHARSGSFDPDDGRFHLMHRIPKVDSSSDNSSLFSCSDEGSCSTESNRDSTSTEEFSDYIFGETGHSWNSPWRISSDSEASSSPMFSRLSPHAVSDRHASGFPEMSLYQNYNADSSVEGGAMARRPQGGSRREDSEGKGSPPFLYSDTVKQCIKLTNPISSSSRSRETDSERLGGVSHFDVKSGVSFRRSTRERTAQTFY